MMILRALTNGPRHCSGITEDLRAVFEDVASVKVGSLHSRLRRMERYGWLRSEWGRSPANRVARFYELTPAGWKQLETSVDDWSRFTALVGSVMLSA